MGLDGGEYFSIFAYCSPEVKRKLEKVDASSLVLRVATSFGVLSLAVSMIICPDRKLPSSLEAEEVWVILYKAVMRSILHQSCSVPGTQDTRPVNMMYDLLQDLAQLVYEPLSTIACHRQAVEFVDNVLGKAITKLKLPSKSLKHSLTTATNAPASSSSDSQKTSSSSSTGFLAIYRPGLLKLLLLLLALLVLRLKL